MGELGVRIDKPDVLARARNERGFSLLASSVHDVPQGESELGTYIIGQTASGMSNSVEPQESDTMIETVHRNPHLILH